ncbi:hypothetical protein B5X24_HaOG206401 [Helicoverpa armigera]|nr:hypothetical protein B5X24_HaOG206401 [Helicoverpa armigera]
MGKKAPPRWDFRDVSSGIQRIRNFLLGRKYVYHNRFPPLISPRSIPTPDIPRGPDYKLANQAYSNRNVLNSVKPPVVAPVAEGKVLRKPKDGRANKIRVGPKLSSSDAIEFSCPPLIGPVWWFDSHSYYKDVCVSPCGSPASSSPPSPPAPPCPSPCSGSEKKAPCPEESTTLEKPCPVPRSDPCAEKPPCELSPCDPPDDKPPPPPPPPKICDPCKPKSGGRRKRRK